MIQWHIQHTGICWNGKWYLVEQGLSEISASFNHSIGRLTTLKEQSHWCRRQLCGWVIRKAAFVAPIAIPATPYNLNIIAPDLVRAQCRSTRVRLHSEMHPFLNHRIYPNVLVVIFHSHIVPFFGLPGWQKSVLICRRALLVGQFGSRNSTSMYTFFLHLNPK